MFCVIAICLLIIYIGILLFFMVGWQKIKPFKSSNFKPSTLITVIVPFRNEEINIIDCLESINQQSYPAQLLQILIVNDSSTDHSPELVKDFILNKPHFKLINIENGTGKKIAIENAIQQAIGSLIFTTDADCIFHNNWITTTVNYYETHKPKMIAGPVSFYEENTLFDKMQSLEFLSLIGIGGASLQNGKPIMCNGANLAYEKEAFLEVNGFKDTNNIPTGDDVFLMFKIKKLYPSGVHFLKSNEAMVKTHAQKDVKAFINQRKRWISKTTLYKDGFVNFVAITSYFFNLFILITALLSLVNCSFINLLIVLFFGKTFIDFAFLYLVCSFFKRTDLLKYILTEQVLYILYVVYIGFVSMFGKYEWKDRKIQH